MKDCELTACKIVFKIKDIYFRKIKIVKKKKKKVSNVSHCKREKHTVKWSAKINDISNHKNKVHINYIILEKSTKRESR